MKVAAILSTFPSESETFIARELEALAAGGMNVTVFAAQGTKGNRVVGSGFPVVYRPGGIAACTMRAMAGLLLGPGAMVRYLVLVVRVLLESPADAMVLMRNFHTIAYFLSEARRRGIHHIHAGFLNWPACIGMAMARAGGMTLSLASHARDIFVECGAIRAKARVSRCIVTCTDQGLGRLMEMLPAADHSKVHRVHHGLGLAGPFDGCPACCRNAKRQVLAVGRLVVKKGYDLLLTAFATVWRQEEAATLVLVGDGPERASLAELAAGLGVADKVTFAGWLPNEAVARLMRESRLLVVPSVVARDGDRDGIPNVILEAFACGLPVVASRLTGIEEVVQDGRTGLTVKVGDVGQLARAIVRMLRDDPLREELAGHAWELLRTQHDAAQNAGRLQRLIEQASGAGNA